MSKEKIILSFIIATVLVVGSMFVEEGKYKCLILKSSCWDPEGLNMQIGEIETRIETLNADNDVELDDVVEDMPVSSELGPTVFFSDSAPVQGDTLVIEIKSDTEPITVTFDLKKIPFVQIGLDSWRAYVGFDPRDSVGSKILSVLFADGDTVSEKIMLGDHVFPVTKFVVPKKLADKGVTQSDITKQITQGDGISITDVINDIRYESYFTQSFIEPLDEWIDAGVFGALRKSDDAAIWHLGVDLRATTGTQVRASNRGEVTLARYMPSFGNTVAVNHGLGIVTLYLHLSALSVEEGDTVDRGQEVGLVGGTGDYSISPHLHFSTKVGGRSTDPRKFLDTVNEYIK